MDPNFIGDGGGGNFSKTAGYQEGHSSNLFLVQTGNNCTQASFWYPNWVFLTKNQIHFLNENFFFQDNAIGRKKEEEVWCGWAINIWIQSAHQCSVAQWNPMLSPRRRLCRVWSRGGGAWNNLGFLFLHTTASWSWLLSCWLTPAPK